MADQMQGVAIPGWACNTLPAFVRSAIGTNCTFGAVYNAVSKKALNRWRKASPAQRAKEAKEAEETVRNLVSIKSRLDSMRTTFRAVGRTYDIVSVNRSGRRVVDRSRWPAWAKRQQAEFNSINSAYQIMATQVYANAYEVDAKTGKPVLPGPAIDAASGLGFGRYEYDPDLTGTEFDGMSIGAAIAANIEAEEFGFDPVITPTVLIVGFIALAVLGVALAIMWRDGSEFLKNRSNNSLKQMQLEAQKEIATSDKIDPATKQQLLKDLDAQQQRDADTQKIEAEKKKTVGEEITETLIPVVVGLAVIGLVFKVLEKRLTS
jgi:hypothetical protein